MKAFIRETETLMYFKFLNQFYQQRYLKKETFRPCSMHTNIVYSTFFKENGLSTSVV